MLALIPLLPLLGFLINGLWYASVQLRGGKALSAQTSGLIATGTIGTSFLLGLVLFFQLGSLPEESRAIETTLFSWISVGTLNIPLAFRLDALNALFVLVITGIGSLIHIFTIGYMAHDEAPAKFFAYLNLFCAFMLVLVLGSSLPVLFLGWEGVGLCSYLLISYWYTDPDKASAGKKAFIVNRIGDLGFLLGMFLIFTTFGTLDFAALKEVVAQTTPSAHIVTIICVLLFVGCTGKSAQLPLFVWLPDAMAGPTPVSALIHAATMVTSGIYLVSRVSFLYTLSHDAMMLMAVVGGVTALFAATIAVAQNDIKKVLAYSTVSQLGLMFLACGVGSFGAGIFHVITHACFKGLMFLGAGSVIHGMHEEQDIMKMGGLRHHMPKTFLVFAAGWLAICGIPPFSGFFSKDEVLWHAYSSSHGGTFLWALGALTALLTAFYMTRLFVLVFLGHSRSKEHAHESSAVMVVPLQILAVLATTAGLIGIPHLSWLGHWLMPIVGHVHLREGVAESSEWVFMISSTIVAAGGIAAAFAVYSNLKTAEGLRARFKTIHTVLANKWYVDEFYEALFVKPIAAISDFLWKFFDVKIIDKIVLSFGTVTNQSGALARGIQTGSTQLYAFMMLVGFVSIVGYTLYGIFQ